MDDYYFFEFERGLGALHRIHRSPITDAGAFLFCLFSFLSPLCCPFFVFFLFRLFSFLSPFSRPSPPPMRRAAWEAWAHTTHNQQKIHRQAVSGLNAPEIILCNHIR